MLAKIGELLESKVVRIIFITAIIATVLAGSIWYSYGTAEIITITVSDKAVKRYNDKDKYLIYTKNGEVFEITDNIFYLRFNSSDDYGKLTINDTYTVKVYGFRINFTSTYRNIIEIKD